MTSCTVPPEAIEGDVRPGGEIKVLQALEKHSDAQLDTCGRLVAVLQTVSEALTQCGATLQREVTNSWQPLSASFTLEPGDQKTEDLSRSLCKACEQLGSTLLTLAAALTGELLTPLLELRRKVGRERQELQQELERLEQREVMCCEAMAESVSRKEKVSGELQERLQQSTKKGSNRMVRWMLKKTSKAEGKLQAAAHAQTAAVEELAGRLDQLALVQSQRLEAAEAFGQLIQRLAQKRQLVLRKAHMSCGKAWQEGARVLNLAFSDVEEEQVETAVPGSECSSPAKARSSVPPLRLSDVPLEEPEVTVMNTDSMASPSGSESGDILNCESSSDAEKPPGLLLRQQADGSAFPLAPRVEDQSCASST